MSLFVRGNFTSAAGLVLPYKIDCDALTDCDWSCIAAMGVGMLPPFRAVHGVPRGGLRLAIFMRQYYLLSASRPLYVDDVWTTGKSMRALVRETQGDDDDWLGFVAFARGPLPDNVKAFCHVGT